jgi:hypothetical protein
MCCAGEGMAQDEAEGARWFLAAAEAGNPLAQYNLGVMYATGQGVARDDVEGHMWLELAAKSGDGTVAGPAAKGAKALEKRIGQAGLIDSAKRLGKLRARLKS